MIIYAFLSSYAHISGDLNCASSIYNLVAMSVGGG